MRDLYFELSEAGNISSRFRREWIYSEMYWDIEREDSKDLVNRIIVAEGSGDLELYELRTSEIRSVLRIRGDKLTGKEWGGAFMADFALLATILGIGVVVWVSCSSRAGGKEDNDVAILWNGLHPQKGGQNFMVRFHAFFWPGCLYLPTADPKNPPGYCPAVQGAALRNRKTPVVQQFRDGPAGSEYYQLMIPISGGHEHKELGTQGQTILSEQGIAFALTTDLIAPLASPTRDDLQMIGEKLQQSHALKPIPLCLIHSVPFGYEEITRLSATNEHGCKIYGQDAYLNDEIISAYFSLLQVRHDKIRQQYLMHKVPDVLFLYPFCKENVFGFGKFRF